VCCKGAALEPDPAETEDGDVLTEAEVKATAQNAKRRLEGCHFAPIGNAVLACRESSGGSVAECDDEEIACIVSEALTAYFAQPTPDPALLAMSFDEVEELHARINGVIWANERYTVDEQDRWDRLKATRASLASWMEKQRPDLKYAGGSWGAANTPTPAKTTAEVAAQVSPPIREDHND